MKVAFKTRELERLYTTPLGGLKGKQKFSKEVIKQYQAKVKILIATEMLKDLYSFRSLNFEALSGNRKGQFSIRLNKQYRLIIVKAEDEIMEIEIIETDMLDLDIKFTKKCLNQASKVRSDLKKSFTFRSNFKTL